MPVLRLALALAAVLSVLAAPAEGAVRPHAGKAPTGLRGFVLTANEPPSRVFARTPSFAWNPVAGAIRYEFQLSTSTSFRENGLVFEDAALTSPTADVPVSLPWITGDPYSLYARVRAVLPRSVTPWSPPWGFNMRWQALPQPLGSEPGLLRWTTVEGALGYDVWFLGPNRVIRVHGNTIDQREHYTLHADAAWTGTVRWRIRAVRPVFDHASHKLFRPTSQFGPWSPVHTTANPPFAEGPLQLVGTASDVVAGPAGVAHRLMPGFAYRGNRTLTGDVVELFRVAVFTDSDCLNEVFRGAITGAPAYAPRPFAGPLALPTSATAVDDARGRYLPQGAEPPSWTFDDVPAVPTESMKPATPTTSLKIPSAPDTKGQAGGSGPKELAVDEKTVGAPVDLWDTEWPRGGYYWTVLGVAARPTESLVTSLSAVAQAASTTITLASAQGVASGDRLEIGTGTNAETAHVIDIAGTTVTLATPLLRGHGVGERVERTSGALVYRDAELPQDVCAAGRVARFGKASGPSLVRGGAPFASGLSPKGRLVAATRAARSFYGPPLVAWTPALGASAYQVQWSKTRYPFRAEPHPETKAGGLLTFSTAARLPLAPGTWWYRVRGFNFSLPTEVQAMSWSDPVQLVVTKPSFRVERKR